nr:unnamed protein product [Callosobruchus chinensis]CAH7763352.1 unnamed protein product [Callosobruchus chinensis]
MYEIIVKRTNEKLATLRPKYKNSSKIELSDVDEIEIRAFLGLLLYTSIFKSNNEDVRSLFATSGKGRPIFRAVVSQKRFLTIMTALRFDNAEDREERRKVNPAAAFQEIFDIFVNNAKNAYKVGASICVDEMLVGFRGKCRFKMYIPSKPEKYGIKIQCVTDARTGYLHNAYIYAGKDTDGMGLSDQERRLAKPTQAVIRLVKHLYNTNRNVTCDNWYGSIELAEHLKKNNLTVVGTVRKNKKEIPPELLPCRDREVGDALYGFTKDMTVLSRTTKKNKAVVLLSTMHHTKSIDPENGLPEINSFYNVTKGGVDSLDEKCAKYSCSRTTRRWPMAIFYKVLDICGTNAYIMFTSFPKNDLTRFQSIDNLADQLVEPHMRTRYFNVPSLPRDLKQLIGNILNIPADCHSRTDDNKEKLETRKYCYI